MSGGEQYEFDLGPWRPMLGVFRLIQDLRRRSEAKRKYIARRRRPEYRDLGVPRLLTQEIDGLGRRRDQA